MGLSLPHDCGLQGRHQAVVPSATAPLPAKASALQKDELWAGLNNEVLPCRGDGSQPRRETGGRQPWASEWVRGVGILLGGEPGRPRQLCEPWGHASRQEPESTIIAWPALGAPEGPPAAPSVPFSGRERSACPSTAARQRLTHKDKPEMAPSMPVWQQQKSPVSHKELRLCLLMGPSGKQSQSNILSEAESGLHLDACTCVHPLRQGPGATLTK